MGMNMLTKATEAALALLQQHFPEMQIVRYGQLPSPSPSRNGSHRLLLQPFGKLLHGQETLEYQLDRRTRKVRRVRGYHQGYCDSRQVTCSTAYLFFRLLGDIVKNVLKTTVQAMVELNTQKNLIGSAMAGSIGKRSCFGLFIIPEPTETSLRRLQCACCKYCNGHIYCYGSGPSPKCRKLQLHNRYGTVRFDNLSHVLAYLLTDSMQD